MHPSLAEIHSALSSPFSFVPPQHVIILWNGLGTNSMYLEISLVPRPIFFEFCLVPRPQPRLGSGNETICRVVYIAS